MAYEMVMPYHLHMPSYFLETFTEYPYKQKPEEENLLFLLPVLFVSFLSSYFPSISFNSSSTAAFNCVSSPFTTVSGELATLISGSNCEFSR